MLHKRTPLHYSLNVWRKETGNSTQSMWRDKNVRVYCELCLMKITRNYCSRTIIFLPEIIIWFLKIRCQIKATELLFSLMPLVCQSRNRSLTNGMVKTDIFFSKMLLIVFISILEFLLIIEIWHGDLCMSFI